jgi:hypothetical protein
MATAFLLGGYDPELTTANDPIYQPLRTGLEAKGYTVVASDISWKDTLLTSYTKQFLDVFDEHKGAANVLIGNSFGAVVALITATLRKVDGLYLCSLSPRFEEDREAFPESEVIEDIGRPLMEDFRRYSVRTLAGRISTSTEVQIVYGEEENETSPPLVRRCWETYGLIGHATIHEIEGAPHDMSNATYTRGVLDLVPSAASTG